MGASKFGFEMDDGKLAWSWPAHAPDVTDDQARTVAIANLAGAVEMLARAISNHTKEREDD